jgi:hypoxanthine phosphoribosyltransferase
MKTIKYTNEQIERMTQEIIRQITLSGYKPDYVVGITRGGLLPALLISQYYNIPMETLRVSLRDHSQQECNAWMSEDAFGCVAYEEKERVKSRWDITKRKNILIVDDINDTGETIKWIKKDWESSCMPNERHAWDSVWGHTVKFATLVNNEASDFKDIDYTSLSINKAEEDSWIEFPWENWWK